MKTKVCTVCKQEKPATLEYFAKQSRSKDGLQCKCKICNKKYREENKKQVAESKKQWYKENKERISKERSEKDKKFRKEHKQQAKERLELLRGKGINYGDEDNFVLDYPTYEEIVKRYQTQGILSDNQIYDALNNTLTFDDCENIQIDKEIKIPTIYPQYNDDEKNTLLRSITNDKFKKVVIQDNISKEKQKDYIREVRKELQTIQDTSAVHTADYFLLNIKLFDLAINKYGGILTRTGRGSCGSFLLNKVLGLTQIDRLTVDLPLYTERFISKARLLENRAIPDFDANVVSQEPFVKASRELLGEHGCYPMIAYGTMKESEAFRNICRSNNLSYDEYNEVAKNIDNYRNDIKWKKYIDEAQKYVGTIISASVHPCAHLLSNDDIESEIGVLKIGDNICTMITSTEADEYKTKQSEDLFGGSEEEEDNIFDKMAIQSAISRKLSHENKVFGTVGRAKTASELSKAGNVIDVEASKERAQQAKLAASLFDSLKNVKGPIADILNETANKIKNAKNKAQKEKIQEEAYEKILSELPKQAGFEK